MTHDSRAPPHQINRDATPHGMGPVTWRLRLRTSQARATPCRDVSPSRHPSSGTPIFAEGLPANPFPEPGVSQTEDFPPLSLHSSLHSTDASSVDTTLSAISQARTSDAVAIAVARKAQDQMRAEGQAAIALIQNAANVVKETSAPKAAPGRVDVLA